MGLSKTKARSLLTERNLRTTAPRMVMSCATANRPMSYSEVLDKLGECVTPQRFIEI